MKATAIASSNIAFIKYWGKKDEELRLPKNSSISMNLSNLHTTTTVEFSESYRDDLVVINGEDAKGDKKERVIRHLDRIRKSAKIKFKAKVVSINSFPAGTGLSSSASGFAALTLAACSAAGLKLQKKQLSILARQASGSACRSIPDGFVEWVEGVDNDTSYGKSIFPANYWDISDTVIVAGGAEKEVSTTDAQKQAFSSPFFRKRLEGMDLKIKAIKEYLKEKNFPKFGQLIEDEALELHAMMATQRPSLLYWYPSTVEIMRLVRLWRRQGLPVYFTLNTGHDIHLICEGKRVDDLFKRLKNVSGIKNIIINKPAEGAKLSDKHLF